MRDNLIFLMVLLAYLLFPVLMWANARRYERMARRDGDRIRLQWFRDAEAIVHRDRRRWTRRFIKGSWPGDCDHGRSRVLCVICKPEPVDPCPHGVAPGRCPVCSPLTWPGMPYAN